MSIYSTTVSRDGREPIAVTVAEAKHLSGLGHTKLWELIGDGTLQTVSIGRRRLVIYASLCRLLTPGGQQQPRRRGRPRKVPANEARP
jgi:hypothetical protein